jgi:hypothetical protein
MNEWEPLGTPQIPHDLNRYHGQIHRNIQIIIIKHSGWILNSVILLTGRGRAWFESPAGHRISGLNVLFLFHQFLRGKQRHSASCGITVTAWCTIATCGYHHYRAGSTFSPQVMSLSAVGERLRKHWRKVQYVPKRYIPILPATLGPGVDSASNRNEYQESSWG